MHETHEEVRTRCERETRETGARPEDFSPLGLRKARRRALRGMSNRTPRTMKTDNDARTAQVQGRNTVACSVLAKARSGCGRCHLVEMCSFCIDCDQISSIVQTPNWDDSSHQSKVMFGLSLCAFKLALFLLIILQVPACCTARFEKCAGCVWGESEI